MSRRFRSRHEKVEADPTAKAPKQPFEVKPLAKKDSWVDPTQPDMVYAKELNQRVVVQADAGDAGAEADEAAADEEDDAE